MLRNQCFRPFCRTNALNSIEILRKFNTNRIFNNRKQSIESQEVIKAEDGSQEWTQIDKLFNKVNNIISNRKCGQNFAVVHMFGKQYVIHNNDIISMRNWIPAEVGETLKLEKCLLIGNERFTLIGRPLLNRDLVQIEATVLEKTMTQTYFNIFAIPRNHRYRRWRFVRFPLSMLRINRIEICHQLNRSQDQVN